MSILQRSLTTVDTRLRVLVITLALLGAGLLGWSPSPPVLMLLVGGAGALVLVNQPDAAFVVLVIAAYSVPLEFGLGNAFTVSAVHLLLPALALVRLLRQALGSGDRLITSRTFIPLVAFLLAASFSWLYGNVTWVLRFPRRPDLLAIQASQWAVYALAVLAYLLAAQQSFRAVRWTTFTFLGLGVLALIDRYGGSFGFIGDLLTAGDAQTNGTFFVWMTALSGAQALYNGELPRSWRVALFLLALSVPLLGFWQNTGWVTSWLPPLIVLCVLGVLRAPGLGLAFVVLAFMGVLLSLDAKPLQSIWESEQGSVAGRIVLWRSVIQLGLRKPLFGLGLTTYHQYHMYIPLLTEGGRWYQPNINSHNLYIDLFAQLGLVGLVVFFWAVAEIGLFAWRLRRTIRNGFNRAYVTSALAGLVGMLVASAIVEWLLPFVYNAGLKGQRFGVFSWVFLGGLVALQGSMRGGDETCESDYRQ